MTEIIVKEYCDEKIKMDYFSFGKGKRILAIIPGLSIKSVMNSANDIVEAYNILSSDFTIYVFDRKMAMPDNYSIFDMANDTAYVIKKLGINKLSLFGASQGGMISMVIAINYPELVENLIVGSSSAFCTTQASKIFKEWILLANERKCTELCLSFGRYIYPKEVFDKYHDFFIEMSKIIDDKELDNFIIMTRSMLDFNILKDLYKIKCPILDLSSKDDLIFGIEASNNLAEALINNEYVSYLYDDYGHAAYDLAPDYKRKIAEFIKKNN